jgi:hypothetical protein
MRLACLTFAYGIIKLLSRASDAVEQIVQGCATVLAFHWIGSKVSMY